MAHTPPASPTIADVLARCCHSVRDTTEPEPAAYDHDKGFLWASVLGLDPTMTLAELGDTLKPQQDTTP